jgi:hypothetical protein
MSSAAYPFCLCTAPFEHTINCNGTRIHQCSLGCSPTGSCPCPCDYSTDASCTCRDLATPLLVSLTKTPVAASYPLQYLQVRVESPLTSQGTPVPHKVPIQVQTASKWQSIHESQDRLGVLEHVGSTLFVPPVL